MAHPILAVSQENVAAALAPGTFYVAGNCSAAYPHCGERRGRTLFYWPKESTPSAAPVLPRMYSLIQVSGASHLVFSNFTFRDASYWSGGAWHNAGSGGTDGPTDGAIVINSDVARLDDPSCGSLSCHKLLAQATDITVEACQFLAGLGGHAVRIGNHSAQVSVVGNHMSQLGQGGVKLGDLIIDGDVPRNLTGGVMLEEAHDCQVTHNVIEDIGLIIKHVAGVALTAVHGNYVAHNRISRSPRYGVSFLTWTNADGSGWGLASDNIVEYNIITDTALETNDVGAINFGNGGDSGYYGWDQNNTVRYNNISRVWCAPAPRPFIMP